MIPSIHGKVEYTDQNFIIPAFDITYFGAEDLFDVFFQRLKKHPFFSATKIEAGTCESSIITVWEERSIAAGAYGIRITPERITIQSSDTEGTCMALTTLYCLLRDGNGSIKCGVIEDAPISVHRGVLIDSCRHFFSAEDVNRMIEQLALRKINRLHWHLSDDQGYRLESVHYPRLNETGSWWTNADGTVYGGYYTRQQVEEIVRFAAVRGMEIIPEIDIPGHTGAIIASYPELSCSGESFQITGMPGISERILCAGKDYVIEFLYNLLDEVIEMFPSKYFHIGGDEAPKKEWNQCGECQKRMQEHDLQNEEELQAWLTEVIVNYLRQHGKTAVCWNEAVKSKNLPAEAVIQYWDEEDYSYCSQNLKEGQKIIYSYSPYFYFDYIHAMVPLRMPLGCKPKYRSGEAIEGDRILGFEAPLWTETIPDREQLERMAFPRVLALSERAWSGVGDPEEFMGRCEQELGYLEADGVRFTSIKDADLSGDEQDEAILGHWGKAAELLRSNGMKEMEGIVYRFLDLKLQEVYCHEEDRRKNLIKLIFGEII